MSRPTARPGPRRRHRLTPVTDAEIARYGASAPSRSLAAEAAAATTGHGRGRESASAAAAGRSSQLPDPEAERALR